MTKFLAKGKSTFLEKNNSLPIINSEGYMQMALLYVKPMVSLHLGLIFTCFGKILNKYKLADDSQYYEKMNRVCTILTDSEGFIYGMNDNCSKQIGMPPPKSEKQLSINDNQRYNIS